MPADVADAILGTLADPSWLVATLRRAPVTLIHGDAWLPNVAFEPRQVVLLDWTLATAGPGLLDALSFCVGCMSNVDLPREEVLAAVRRRCAPDADDEVWQAALFWALCELGWNKALDATDHPDPAQRAYARAELDWWVGLARSPASSVEPDVPITAR